MKVSVVVITYNQEAYLAATLDSILAQRCDFAFEVVVGEDCSTDGTRNICLDYQAKHPQTIRLLLHDKNQGMVENYYQTLELCRGEYVAMLDGDDYWCDPLKLQKQVDFLEGNLDYALIHGGMIVHNMETGGEKILPTKNISGWCYDKLLRGNFIYNSTVCFRRKRLETVDTREIRQQRFYSQDWPLWLALARGGKFHAMPEAVTLYRLVSGSVGRPGSLEGCLRVYESNRAVLLFYAQKYHAADTAFRRRVNAKYNYEILKRLIKESRRNKAVSLLAGLHGADFFNWKILKAYWAVTFPFCRRLLFK